MWFRNKSLLIDHFLTDKAHKPSSNRIKNFPQKIVVCFNILKQPGVPTKPT